MRNVVPSADSTAETIHVALSVFLLARMAFAVSVRRSCQRNHVGCRMYRPREAEKSSKLNPQPQHPETRSSIAAAVCCKDVVGRWQVRRCFSWSEEFLAIESVS